jgi:hypothetical protein
LSTSGNTEQSDAMRNELLMVPNILGNSRSASAGISIFCGFDLDTHKLLRDLRSDGGVAPLSLRLK